MALHLGREGARVALNYAHDEQRAKRAFAEFQAQGSEGVLLRADVTDPTGVEGLVREVENRLGPVEVLVPSATCAQPQKPIEEYDWDFYQAMLDFFLKSPYLLARACLPAMKERRFGRIVNIGSEVYDRGVGNFSAYVAAKGGQRGWTRSMATELAPWGITVNMVSPGWIPVERHANDPQELKDQYLSGIPVGHWGVPDDVAAAVAYLASDEAGFVTGQTLVVNGGVTTC
jgi:3-oxoacyl-[acyl-carrier protein] reductase